MSNDKKLNEILNEFANQKPFRQKLVLQRIERIWNEEMGEMITKYTDQIYLRKHTLVIQVTSSALRHQLVLSKEKIIQKLNFALGEEYIEDILVY